MTIVDARLEALRLEARPDLASPPDLEVDRYLPTRLLVAWRVRNDDLDPMRLDLGRCAAQPSQEELQVEEEAWVANEDVQSAHAPRSGRNGVADHTVVMKPRESRERPQRIASRHVERSKAWLYGQPVEGSPFRDVEDVLDRHARRLAGQLGKLLIDVGQALQDEAGSRGSGTTARKEKRSEPTRDELYREATRLGVKGRARMSKEELKAAIARSRRQH